MQIEWRDKTASSPFLFRQVANWSGVRLHRAKVLPGRMLEHTANTHEVNITLRGKLFREGYSDTGRRLLATGRSGNICITPAGKAIAASWDEPLDNMGFMLDTSFVAQTAAENGFSSTFSFIEMSQAEDPLIQHLGLALLKEADPDSAAGQLYADSLIQSLVLHILKNYSTAVSSNPGNLRGGLSGYRLRRVKEFIESNLSSDLGLAELSAIADLSRYHFARAFRTSTGVTPQHYLMQRRIENAKLLLADTDIPLVEVGLRTGFKNQSHFTTLFRKATRLTPRIWRELKLA